MKDEMEGLYQLICENEAKGTVDTPGMPKPGEGMIDGDKQQAPKRGGDSAAAKAQSKPQDMDKDLNPGHGSITEDKEIEDMLPESKFDSLFKSTLLAEEDGLEAGADPLEATGEGEFNDELGDFDSESGDEDLGEEVDVATELRMIIDRLTEVAEKMGAFDDEGGGEDEFGGEEVEAGEEDFSDEGGTPGFEENVTYGKGGSGKAGGPGKGNDGKLGSFPDKTKTMQSKGSMKVKAQSNMGQQTAKGKGSPGVPGKGHDGKLGAYPDKTKTMQSKGSQVVKSEMGKAGRSIFD